MKMFDAVIDVNHQAYCGPRAIAHLTGVPVSHIEKMLRRGRRGGYRDRNGRKIPIKGTYTWEVIRVLERLGCKVTKINAFENTLGRFCEDTKHLDATFLVEVTGHFLVVHKGVMSDSLPRPKRRVNKVWQVEAPAEPRYTPPTPKPAKPKLDLKEVRYKRVLDKIASWQTKLKRAENALRKLRKQQRYYERTNQKSAAPLCPEGGGAAPGETLQTDQEKNTRSKLDFTVSRLR